MTALDRLVDSIDQLTRPRTHRQPYSYHDEHGTLVHTVNVVHVVSLLEQLGHTVTLGGGTDLSAGHSVPTSRPTGRLEALDVLMAIDVECTQVVAIYGGTERPSLPDNLRGLVGLSTGLDTEGQEDIARSASRWVSRAMSVTGWADPAWRPNNSCPLCEQKRSLRVRIITAAEIHASCVSCGEAWGPDTIGLLAEHLRWENGDETLEEAG